MNKLKFDAESHVYTLGGERLPSVTQVLATAGLVDFSGISEDVLNRAKAFGTAVHSTTAYHDKGNLDVFGLDPSLQGPLNAWIKFRAETGFLPHLIEKPLYSEKYRFAGTPDRIGTIGKENILVELKSGVLLPSMAVQMAGYEILSPERISQRIGVQLLQDGTYKIAPPKWMDRSDKSVFLSCLNVYNYRKRIT